MLTTIPTSPRSAQDTSSPERRELSETKSVFDQVDEAIENGPGAETFVSRAPQMGGE